MISLSPSGSVAPAKRAAMEMNNTWQPTKSCRCTGPLILGVLLRMGSAGGVIGGSGLRDDGGLSPPPPPLPLPPPPPPPAAPPLELDRGRARSSLLVLRASAVGAVAARSGM